MVSFDWKFYRKIFFLFFYLGAQIPKKENCSVEIPELTKLPITADGPGQRNFNIFFNTHLNKV